MTARRTFDLIVAAILLVLAAPLILLGMLAIKLTSPGPVFYRCTRVGRSGRAFTMYKLRTMHVATPSGGAAGSRITGSDDPRVFTAGRLLRRAKIDELPQLFNVLRGEMSLVGPRPEDPALVRRHYAAEHLETLRVRPGLASPGTIYATTHGEAHLTGPNPEIAYAQQVLPIKLALDTVYVRRASTWYDIRLLCRAVKTVGLMLAGRREFGEPPEMLVARKLVVPARNALQPSWVRQRPPTGDRVRGQAPNNPGTATAQA